MKAKAITVALTITLAALTVISLSMYGQQLEIISNLSSELTETSLQIDQQNQKVDEFSTLVSTQQLELANMGVQLESLQGRIDELTGEIEHREMLIAAKTAQVERLQTDLDQSEEQLVLLEEEISTLQSEIQAKDRDLAELILANAAAKRVHVTHYGLGVNEDDEGIVFPIEIEIIGSGAGRISVDVSNVQYAASFQTAVRTAAEVASDYTGVTMSNRDVIVRLVNDSDDVIRVDGPSAGAVIAVMLVAGLEEKQLDPDILLTGAIESDGTIGPVGGLQGKADAAADYGAEKLLVPDGQEFQNSRIEIEGAEDIDDLADRMIIG